MNTRNRIRIALCIAAMAMVSVVLMTSSANAITLYEDFFDADGLGTNTGVGGGILDLSTADTQSHWEDALQDGTGNPADIPAIDVLQLHTNNNNGARRGNAQSVNDFTVTNGFTLEVTYKINNVGAGSGRAVIGLMDGNGTTGAGQWLREEPQAQAGFGLNMTTDRGAQGLNFDDGAGTVTPLSNLQPITTGTHTVIMAASPAGWRYSIDGAPAIFGPWPGGSFDFTHSYNFDVYSQNRVTDLEIHHVLLTDDVPPAPAILNLHVNTTSGEMFLIGGATEDIDLAFYEITSAGGLSLNDTGWLSLADQDFEGSGGNSGTGDGWEESGGIGTHALAESYLLGSSTIGVADAISLGDGYDTTVNAQDLEFFYRHASGLIHEGTVIYTVSGDFDFDGDVDGADFLSWQRGESPSPLSPEDLATWVANYGGAPLAATSTSVPEPSAMLLAVAAALMWPRHDCFSTRRART